MTPALLIGLYIKAVLVASAIEVFYIVVVRRQKLDFVALGASYFIGFVRTNMERIAAYTLAIPLVFFAYKYRIATIPLTIWTFPILFLAEEFFYYWRHRIEHENRWFWATHFGHHTSEEMNISAAFRVSWTDQFAGNTIFLVPLALCGFPPVAIILCFTISNVYQIWLHTNLVPKLGWFEWVFNTPSHHRVHHARNPEYINANYGGMLIIFDRIFGTCVEERDDLPCDYGSIPPFYSRNPLKIEFHGWLEFIRDLRHAPSWGDRLKLIFGRVNTSRRISRGASSITAGERLRSTSPTPSGWKTPSLKAHGRLNPPTPPRSEM